MQKSLSKGVKKTEEITMIDVAITFIRRRFVFYVVFSLGTLAGMIYALGAEQNYDYVSLIQLGEKGQGEPLQMPEVTIAKLTEHWIPEVENAYRSDNGEKLPFDIKVKSPLKTNLVRLWSSADTSEISTVKEVHQAIINLVGEYQTELFDREKAGLNSELASINKALNAQLGNQLPGDAIGSVIEKRAILEKEIEVLKSYNILSVARQSGEQVGLKPLVIIILTSMLAGLLGILMAFGSEFIAKVRRQMKADLEHQHG